MRIFGSSIYRLRLLPLMAASLAACSTAHAALIGDVIFISDFVVEPPAVADVTADHNVVRAGVGVGPLFWDERLAATAQAWAATCTGDPTNTQIIHNPNRSSGYPFYVGENIASGTGTLSVATAVNLWASEQQYYDYASNVCTPPLGQTCGHYTQLVWANSYLLGCGTALCPNLVFSHVLVCNYAPGGNIGAEKPY